MNIFLGGVRGTRPVAETTFLRFGGDSTCVFVRGAGGEQVVLDAGTGLRNVEAELDPEVPVLMLLTHYHLDHLMGLPSFPLLYRPECALAIAAPPRGGLRVSEVIGRFLTAPFWPIPLDDMPAVRFTDLPDRPPEPAFAVGGLRIRWAPVHHRNGCHAYRIDEPATGASFVFATDVEWALSSPEEREGLRCLCAAPTPCDLLAMDGQFSHADYSKYRDWGHSRWEDVVEVASASGARRALVTHHAPDAADARLEAVERQAVAAMAGAALARQGMRLELGDAR
jgi:phosphoribosyl 1,2-cyclic phosphodiesterase